MKKKQSTKQANTKDTKEISYGFKTIIIENFLLTEPKNDITENFSPESLKFGYGFNFFTDKQNDLFVFTLHITYKYHFDERIVDLINLTTTSVFNIENLNKYLNEKNQLVDFPNNLMIIMFNLSYSSTRGILFEKTQGSFMNQFLLPIINPAEAIERKLKQLDEPS